ncbi:GNAT family N-acetyltransferase [Paenibacillus tengchongensis]|uniref:GNAT family N-acetyltransferase n=1 Tax=Paenibacillus tengchongensis TaxID=2608684 RepID=UPI00124CF187
MQQGFGYAALAGQEVAGVCYSSFVTENTHAIGIETTPDYRGQGVGTLLANLVINDQMRHGFTPYWDCSLDNEASRRLALSLGFEQVHRYRCRGFGI